MKILHGLLALACLGGQVPAYADVVELALSNSSFSVQVSSLKERQFRHTIRQKYDFSCGSAALATLLTHHYRFPASEQDVFTAMYQTGDKAKIQRLGFSMADMKQYLGRQGFEADGYSLSLDAFAELGVPAIALININGYNHFVVIKGVRGDSVLVGDPALGIRAFSRSAFEGMWTKVVLLVLDHKDVASPTYNRPADWNIVEKAPLDEALYREAFNSWVLMMRGPNDF